MDEIERYWLAGLLEGEGSFSHGPPSKPNYPALRVQMIDEDVIARAARLMGTVYRAQRRPPPGQTQFVVTRDGIRGVELMFHLKPLLGLRRQARIQEIGERYQQYRERSWAEGNSWNQRADLTLSWLAGLLEGEGYFGGASHNHGNRLRIALSMTDEDIVAKAASLLNVSYYPFQPANRKQRYQLEVSSLDAYAWMGRFRPYMGMRRQAQIDRAWANFDPQAPAALGRGTYNSNNKLSEAQVLEIYQRTLRGEDHTKIGADFGVTQRAVHAIATGQNWSWLTGAVRVQKRRD